MTLEVTDIMEILPHRYPMLLVDRIIELEPMKYAIGIKNATFDEQFFQGHFHILPVCCRIFGKLAHNGFFTHVQQVVFSIFEHGVYAAENKPAFALH